MYFFYYYPIGVDVARPRVPWTTVLLAALLIAIFVACFPLARFNTVPWFDYAYRPAQVDLLRPLTAIFLHGGWLHLAGNLLYLWVFAPALERALGRLGLLIVFLGTGYLGNLIHGAIVLHLHPDQAWSGVVGASGAISGLLGLFLLRYPWARIRLAYWAFLPLQGVNRTGTTHLPAAVGVALWVAMQLAFWWVQGDGGGTAYGAHIGGLATGCLLALSLGMPRRASIERLRVQADRYRSKGNVHAAVGLFRRYLERAPWDDDARLEFARTLQLAGDRGHAMSVYRRLMKDRAAEGKMDEACELYLEARRGNHVFHAEGELQRKLAFWLEKKGQYPEAVDAYMDLARYDEAEENCVHALARAATLLATRIGDERGGRELLEKALHEFPTSALRPLLEQEVRSLSPARTVWGPHSLRAG